MKKQILMFGALLLAIALLTGVNGCKKDEPTALTLSTLVAGSIDMNGVTTPSNVPVSPSIVATFSTDVDPLTATSANIKLKRDYDAADIDLNISVNGKTITIEPTEDLASGALHKLTFSASLKSKEGELLKTDLERTFTTAGFFAPTGMVAYWNFDTDANDQVGSNNPSAIVDITYADGRKAEAGKAAQFNGTTSIIEIPNADPLITTHDFTISFWVKTNSADITHGHFVMGLGAFYGLQFEINGSYKEAKFAIQYEEAEGKSASEDMWFPSNATDNTNGGWQGWDYAKSLTDDEMIALLKDNWLHVVYTFNGEAKKGILYYNGEKMKSFDFNLWPDGDAKKSVFGMKYAGVEPDVVNDLAFGFIQSRAGTMWDNETWGGYDFPDANHFKGMLDDIRIFHKTITPAEVLLIYNSEKP